MDTKQSARHHVFSLSSRLMLVLALLATLFLSACIQQENEKKDLPNSTHPEYTETVIDFPEGVYNNISVEKTNSGKIWLVGTRSTDDLEKVETLLWELNDDNSWKEIVNFDELLGLNKSDYVFASSVTKNNKALCYIADFDSYISEMKLFLIDPELEGGYRELTFDTSEFIGENSEAESYSLDPQI